MVCMSEKWYVSDSMDEVESGGIRNVMMILEVEERDGKWWLYADE